LTPVSVEDEDDDTDDDNAAYTATAAVDIVLSIGTGRRIQRHVYFHHVDGITTTILRSGPQTTAARCFNHRTGTIRTRGSDRCVETTFGPYPVEHLDPGTELVYNAT
jgi:hypothetical protein